MRLTFTALRATCEPHTVMVGARRVAGYLVRHSGSRKDLGYVWRESDWCWHWRTPGGQHFGERTNQRAAVEVLVEIAKLGDAALAHYTQPLPFEVDITPTVERPAPKPKPKKPPLPAPRTAAGSPPPTKPPAAKPPTAAKPTITWADVPDLTDAVERALKRRRP